MEEELNIKLLRHQKCVEALKESILFLDENHKGIIEDVLEGYRSFLDNHNKENITVVNPTNKELGLMKLSINFIVWGFYTKLNPAIKKNRILKEKVIELCRDMTFSEELLSCKILILRKRAARNENFWNLPRDKRKASDLEKALDQHLKRMALTEFQEKNNEFINNNLI